MFCLMGLMDGIEKFVRHYARVAWESRAGHAIESEI